MSPGDLAHLHWQSLNMPRAREALSIKDAGGHALSFEQVVYAYFVIHCRPSTKHGITQRISNEWQTYFDSLERLFQHELHKQLTALLTNGPLNKVQNGNSVYWAPQPF